MNNLCVIALVLFGTIHMSGAAGRFDSKVRPVALSSNDTVTSLAAGLTKDSLDERLQSIRKLGLISNKESRAALVAHFQDIPQPEPATDSRQPEKTAIVEVLSRELEPSQFQAFALPVLEKEMAALRAAKKLERENYYPKDLVLTTMERVNGSGPSPAIINALRTYAEDKEIPSSVRSSIKVLLVDQQFRQDGVTAAHEKAQAIINVIEPGPTLSTPWNIYNDRDKRVAYGKTTEVKRARKAIAEWLSSDAALENAALEQVLTDLGMTSVVQLLDAAEAEHGAEDRRAYFILLASSILRNRPDIGGELSEQGQNQVARLRQCIDGMKDKGAFSRRARAAANLNAIYSRLGIDTRVNIAPLYLTHDEPMSE